MAAEAANPRSLLLHPEFRTLWVAQLVSVFGDFLLLFGVVSLITFHLHRTPSDVAFAIASFLLPLSLLAPFAGVLVDRWNVKRVMIASDLTRAAIAASFIFVRDVQQIDLGMALLGLFSSFFGPAHSVALRVLIPPADLLAANALLAQAFYAVRILSPAIAGALVAALSEKACFWADAASFVFSAAMIGRLTISRPPVAGQESSLRALGRDFVEGNRFIFTHRGLSLAREAVHPFGVLRMATAPAVSSFSRSWATHPLQLGAAALWAFSSDRVPEIETCAAVGLPCHVLWAERDTILSRKDGREFARRLHATFTVAKRPPGYRPIDHDWMFDDPELFAAHLEQLGLHVLSRSAA